MSEENDILLESYPPLYPPSHSVHQQPQEVMQQPQQRVPANPPGDQVILSILTIIFCCLPLRVIALVKSLEARSAYQIGRHQESMAAIRAAKYFNLLSITICSILVALFVFFELAWILPVAIVVTSLD